MNEEERLRKGRARSWTKYHLRRLEKPMVCRHCGYRGENNCGCRDPACKHKIQFHHIRYEKKEEVNIPLCEKCHYALHKLINPKPHLKHFTCKICGKKFSKYKKKAYFCSNQCKFKSYTTRKEVPCENCGKMSVKQVCFLKKLKHFFCSSRCFGLWRNGKKFKFRLNIPCDNCGKILFLTKREARLSKFHFCNRACSIQQFKHGGKLWLTVGRNKEILSKESS